MNPVTEGLPDSFWGIPVPGPVALASGTCGFGLELDAMGLLEDVALVFSKAVTPEPRDGNAPPRIHDTGYGLLNSIGLANPGLDRVLSEVLPAAAGLSRPLVLNVACESVSSFGSTVAALEAGGSHAGYEVNVSCPNVEAGGMAFGVDPAAVASVTRAVRLETRRPITVKLTPNGGDMGAAAKAAEDSGADAVTVCNTFLGMKLDWRTGRPVLARGVGGYSSPALLPLVVARVWQVGRAVRIPVIASGGVWEPGDVLELLAAGASLVQVGTGLLRRPSLPSELAAGIRELLCGT
ncbi:MAG TPA: dihydroorotate dehydrogenase [Candidatus Fermentibacter sp.]|nr:dihydroorotate dehydrogenase [Candidatus Fermentibacter sp.]